MTPDEWREKVIEYNRRPLSAEIRVNDFGIEKQMSDMTHELGHATDWDGTTFRSRAAWGSQEVRALQGKYGNRWLDNLDEIQDEEIRLFASLGKSVREAESVKKYLSQPGATPAFAQYFRSVEEVWARAYAQWVTEVSGDRRLKAHLTAYQEKGYQFSDEEFAEIRPIIERILRLRGLMR